MELVNNFIHHDKTHMGEKPHECNKCDKTFMKKLCLINHDKTHMGEKPHECYKCDKTQ